MRLSVDYCSAYEMIGWIDDEGAVIGAEFSVNGNNYTQFPTDGYRQDLEKAGFGDGHRGFAIRPELPFKPGDHVLVRRGDRILLTVEILPRARTEPKKGDFRTRCVLTLGANDPTAHSVSQQRWRGDEPDAGLTFGALMTGDTLWDLYICHHTFCESDRILEIGPGYGRS